jgi:hypothetical protein
VGSEGDEAYGAATAGVNVDRNSAVAFIVKLVLAAVCRRSEKVAGSRLRMEARSAENHGTRIRDGPKISAPPLRMRAVTAVLRRRRTAGMMLVSSQ